MGELRTDVCALPSIDQSCGTVGDTNDEQNDPKSVR